MIFSLNLGGAALFWDGEMDTVASSWGGAVGGGDG